MCLEPVIKVQMCPLADLRGENAVAKFSSVLLAREGTVLDVDLNKGAHVIQFDGMGTPRSISLRAKLEKIGP